MATILRESVRSRAVARIPVSKTRSDVRSCCSCSRRFRCVPRLRPNKSSRFRHSDDHDLTNNGRCHSPILPRHTPSAFCTTLTLPTTEPTEAPALCFWCYAADPRCFAGRLRAINVATIMAHPRYVCCSRSRVSLIECSVTRYLKMLCMIPASRIIVQHKATIHVATRSRNCTTLHAASRCTADSALCCPEALPFAGQPPRSRCSRPRVH
ncbi:hypothetical protein V1505DRAFT_6097 [Lipomyces doorenjongii]